MYSVKTLSTPQRTVYFEQLILPDRPGKKAKNAVRKPKEMRPKQQDRNHGKVRPAKKKFQMDLPLEIRKL